MPGYRMFSQLFTAQMDFVTYPDFQGNHHQMTIVIQRKTFFKMHSVDYCFPWQGLHDAEGLRLQVPVRAGDRPGEDHRD